MSTGKIKINTALFSVTDKSHLVDFALGLLQVNRDLQIISSGGTAKTLEAAGISTTGIAQYTGFPECFDGRVKTLHPAVAGGILMRRGKDDAEAKELGIATIDLVVCNLYRFSEAAKEKDLDLDALIEFMDIGGSTLIRASVKNHAGVAIITDASDYANVLKEVEESGGYISAETRNALAAKAINLSADYEAALARELTKRLTGEEPHRPILKGGQKLRYGENPDQKAWFYQLDSDGGIAQAKVLTGKDPSYNNYEDATAAYQASQQLKAMDVPCGVAIIKHGSLCGYATGPDLEKTFERAWQGDSKSAFGSVISVTSCVSEALIPLLKGKFIEVIIAPHFDEAFVSWVKEKRPQLRLLEVPHDDTSNLVYKNISGGLLVQTKKRLSSIHIDDLLKAATEKEGKLVGVVTKAKPKQSNSAMLSFAIAAANFSKSNAIAIIREWMPGYHQVIGVGSGQPNRIDSLQRLALPKAIENLIEEHKDDPNYDVKNELKECILASDGFFPFDDSLRYAAKEGIACFVQPGGSIRDDEVIAAANEIGASMIFTGERYFSH